MIGLVLLRELAQARLCAVELQPRLAEVARLNLADNDLAHRGRVLELDAASPEARRALPGASFDWVVSNPPYQAIGRGATNPDGELAIARHELRLPLAQLIAQTRRILRPRGQAAFVYPTARLVELLAAARVAGLAPLRLRHVHPRVGDASTRALVLCEKGGAEGRLVVDAPVYEYEVDGRPTAELRRVGGEPAQ